MLKPARTFFALLLLLPLGLSAQSDSAATAGVVATIRQLFDGMRNADSVAVQTAFHPEARLQTAVVGPDGIVKVQNADLARFARSVGTAPRGILDERLLYTEIRVDGPLATAWTPYTFVLRGQISHCGVNAFQLVNVDNRWQILQITDTRRQTGCDTTTTDDAVADLDSMINRWHRAAATADEEVFFGTMTPQGIYIGTDATEHWTRDTFARWAAEYFQRDAAWDFKPYDRHVFLADDGEHAWWDELLETWMGPCRGSGVAVRDEQGRWKIAHYHLSVTVPNEKINEFRELTRQ